MEEGTYQRPPLKVRAVRWTGDNRGQIEDFLRPVDEAYDGIGLRFTADEESGERYDDYNMVLFSAWGDDQEADPGFWLVVDPDDPKNGQVMTDAGFTAEGYQLVAEKTGDTPDND